MYVDINQKHNFYYEFTHSNNTIMTIPGEKHLPSSISFKFDIVENNVKMITCCEINAGVPPLTSSA